MKHRNRRKAWTLGTQEQSEDRAVQRQGTVGIRGTVKVDPHTGAVGTVGTQEQFEDREQS